MGPWNARHMKSKGQEVHVCNILACINGSVVVYSSQLDTNQQHFKQIQSTFKVLQYNVDVAVVCVCLCATIITMTTTYTKQDILLMMSYNMVYKVKPTNTWITNHLPVAQETTFS